MLSFLSGPFLNLINQLGKFSFFGLNFDYTLPNDDQRKIFQFRNNNGWPQGLSYVSYSFRTVVFEPTTSSSVNILSPNYVNQAAVTERV